MDLDQIDGVSKGLLLEVYRTVDKQKYKRLINAYKTNSSFANDLLKRYLKDDVPKFIEKINSYVEEAYKRKDYLLKVDKTIEDIKKMEEALKNSQDGRDSQSLIKSLKNEYYFARNLTKEGKRFADPTIEYMAEAIDHTYFKGKLQSWIDLSIVQQITAAKNIDRFSIKIRWIEFAEELRDSIEAKEKGEMEENWRNMFWNLVITEGQDIFSKGKGKMKDYASTMLKEPILQKYAGNGEIEKELDGLIFEVYNKSHKFAKDTAKKIKRIV